MLGTQWGRCVWLRLQGRSDAGALGAAVPGIAPCQPRAQCSTVMQPCSPAPFGAPFPAGGSSVITGEVGASTGKPSMQLRPSKKPTDI